MSAYVDLIEGGCLEVLPQFGAGSFDAVITDPPYGLAFMGKAWDCGGATFRPETWRAALRVLKPGGYLLAFGGTRTYHRLACAVEDAGFEVRDCLMWLYGQGFPKGQGCLKPAWEPILLARRPGPRVLPLGIDECRVPTEEDTLRTQNEGPEWSGKFNGGRRVNGSADGRYPANVCHDGSAEVLEAFAAFGEGGGGARPARRSSLGSSRTMSPGARGTADGVRVEMDSGSAARFFYCAKASKSDRGEGNSHPTVKPTALLRWLVRLVCPPGGLVLDPFAGSGTTGVAALAEGRRAVLVEREPAYCAIIRRRLAEARGPLFAEAGS